MWHQSYGAKDGKYSSLEEFRREQLLEVIATPFSCLEVGPFSRPTFKNNECHFKSIDYYSTEELRKHSLQIGLNPDDVIEVDYVCKTENYCEVVKDKFDVVIAAHVVEHVINFVTYFQTLHSLLNEGGYLLCVLPDKRYSFDKFRPDTNLAQLLFEYLHPDYPWHSLHSLETAMYYDMSYIGRLNSVKERLDICHLRKAANEWHPGVHSHVFQFEDAAPKIFAPLCAMSLIDFDVVDSRMCTQFGEFSILLQAGNNNTDYDKIRRFYNPARDTIIRTG